MRHDDTRKPRRPQHPLQPLNPFQVQMVGRLIEQQHIGLRHHGFGNGEPLAPATTQRRRFGVHAHRRIRPIVGKPGAAKRLAQPLLVLILRNAAGRQCRLQHAAYGRTLAILRYLLYISHARPFAHGHLARVGLDFPRQHGQQRRLPRPIRPNQPNTVVLVHSKTNVLK